MPDRLITGAIRFLDGLFRGAPLAQVGFRLWDGSFFPDAGPRRATIVLNHPSALRQMFGAGSEMALAEAYLHGAFDIEGEIEAAFDLAEALPHGLGWRRSLTLSHLLRKMPRARRQGPRRAWLGGVGRRHSQARDRQAIAFHYDLSNDFYRLWLDREIIYSCAYFQDASDTLDAAQAAKLDYLCRKLRLKPGQRLLDIGCGWGGLALHAARHFGVEVVGVSLSEKQVTFGQGRVLDAGLADRVAIQLRDYREVEPERPFDAIVSVGMAEHLGRENLPGYFKKAFALLKPGGVFLNHAIGEGPRYRSSRGPSFIDEYVFPDSDIVPIRMVIAAAESAGFEVRDVENLREHYALTLRHWVRRLEAHHEEALAFVSELTFRVWKLYMAGSAHGFAGCRLAIYQTLLSRPDEAGEAHLPLTRKAWYG